MKFLLSLFACYVIFRLLFNGLFGAKVYHFNQHNHYNDKEPGNTRGEKPAEGTIIVDPGAKTKNKTGNSDSKAGEYVDFEEVK